MIKLTLDPIMGINAEVRVRALVYNLEDKSVTIYCRVYPTDENGNALDLALFKPYDVELTANNTTIVNMSDGSYVDTTAEGYVFDEHTMQGEYDYFKNIASTQPVIVDNLILAKLEQAKSINRFAV